MTFLCSLVSQAQNLTVTGQADVRSETSGGKKTSRSNVVVWLSALDEGSQLRPVAQEKPASPPKLVQKKKNFEPHILVVPVGTTVEFLNSDKVAHNVFWPSISGNKKLGHNMGTWPTGEKRPFKFDAQGVVTLLCNVHPEMAGYLVVSPTPYFAESDDSGAYKIKDVPDGSYTVTAWHEGAKNQSKPVTVAGGGKADFTLTK